MGQHLKWLKQTTGGIKRAFLSSLYFWSLKCRAGIFKNSIGARNRAGIGLSYRPARLLRLAEFIPWSQFLGSINF
jgi:hypothetical protein